MRVSGINSAVMSQSVKTENQQKISNNLHSYSSDTVSFKGFATSEAFSKLLQKGIYYSYEHQPEASRDFVSSCILRSVEIMESLFGRGCLPKKITLAPLDDGVLGQYRSTDREVIYNSNETCFRSMQNLTSQALSNINFILPALRGNGASTIHPAYIFFHELAHSAHWEHLVSRNGEEKAETVWCGLANSPIPNLLGRYVARMGKGSYAVDSKDMCEFVAETISQDICEAMPLASSVSFKDTDVNKWNIKDKVDVDYDTIFDRRHNYRYSSPQSYFDYFMQQTWRGDIDSINDTLSDIEGYLAGTDSSQVPDIVTDLNGMLRKGSENVSDVIISAGNSITSKIDEVTDTLRANQPEIGTIINSAKESIEEKVQDTVGTILVAAEDITRKTSEIFGKVTSSLDKLNRIKIKKPW